MKKRLLSAALALAMVLTMLPLTAFAANPPDENDLAGDGTETVTYQATPDGNNYLTKGWYVTFQKKETDPSTNKEVTKTYYVKVTKGLAVNNKYYSTKNYSDTTGTPGTDGKTVYKGIYNVSSTGVATLKSSTIQVIGGTGLTIDAYGASSLNVDVYSGSVTIEDSGSQVGTETSKTAKLATITVTNTKKDYPTAAGSDAPAVTLDSSVDTISQATDKRAMKLSLTGVECSDDISWTGANVARSVTLTNATIGEVTMSGVLTGDSTKQSGQTLTVNTKTSAQANIDPSVGDVDITGNGSKITIGDVNAGTDPTVALKGTSTSLTLNGTAMVGTVTLQGATADDVGGANKTTSSAPPSVTINKGTTAASIELVTGHDAAAEKSTGKYVVKVYGTVTGDIELTGMAADVDVDGGTTDAITVGSGTIDVTGTYTEVGDVTVLKNATFTLATSAKNCTVGALIVGNGGDPKTCEFKVPNEPSNTLGNTTASVKNYNKATIEGGTWVKELPADVMKNLAYQLKAGTTGKETYTYYNEDQLGDALTAQYLDSTNNVLSLVGETVTTGAITITFKNANVTFGELKKMGAGTIKLPTEVNGTKVSKWSDGSFITDAGKDYSVKADATDVTLDAQGNLAGSNITKLLNATVYGDDQKQNPLPITAAVNGTVITLSGAVTKGQHRYYLFFETDAVEESSGKEAPVTLKVELDYNANTGKLTFANMGSTDLGNGVMQEGFDTIVLSNGTRYTLNGTGLKVPSQDIKIPKLTGTSGSDEITGYSYIEVDVRASGYTTDSQKAAVAALLKGTGCSFDWSDSPAMNRAINAVQAGITEKQVEDWITAANRQAWTDNTRESYTKDKASAVCYDQVWLVPFLKISVTDYKPNGSITMSLTPSYRIEVRKSSAGTAGNVNSYVVKANEGKFYSPNANGTSLTLTSKDLTNAGSDGVNVTFGLNTTNFTQMHQDNTYVYTGNSGTFTITNAGTSGLGTVVINNTAAYVTLADSKGVSKGVFDTLQAAVDASEDGDEITVAPGYKSTDTITVTGKPRTITVNTSTILTVSNASGGLVDVDKAGGSKIYTIKLNREVVVNNSASIGVGTASNGTATVNMTRATAGSTVTITVNPSNGYRSLAPTVRTNSGAAVSVSGSGNTYTFVVPNGATSITVTPSFVQNTGLPFTDVAANAWYFDGVAYCYNTTVNGYRLLQGTGDTTYAPNSGVTRADVMQVLYNLAGRPAVGTARYTFTDVPSNQWYYNAVTWAANMGYAEGYGDGTFQPNRNVSRQELACFLHRYAGKPNVSGNLSGYADGQGVASWAMDAMRWATSYSILSGTNSVSLNGRLDAYSTAYRSQVAVTLQRYHQYYK